MTLDGSTYYGDTIQREVSETALIDQIRSLRYSYTHTRFSQYKVRRNLLSRISLLERQLSDLMAATLKDASLEPSSLYHPSVAYNKAGFKVTLELSLDGTYYSNPAPTVPANATVWVRATIDESHHGDAGIPRTHQMFRLLWLNGKGYIPQDSIPAAGHDVYAVCWPLVITRKFTAPSSETKRNFIVDVWPYELIP